MNRILFSLFLCISLLSWACNSPQGESGDTDTDTEAAASSENTPEPTGAAESSDLYAVEVTKEAASPHKKMTATVGGVDLTITYGSPTAKGRTLWGELVPYGKVWRTGADEATTFEVSKSISIAGKELPAGKYGFFTVPDENDWTLVFNETADQWGAYNYDESKDVIRVKVVPQTTESASESLEFKVMEGDQVVIHWGNLMVPFEVKAAG